jgi:rhamnosyl/mannosyltransferase
MSIKVLHVYKTFFPETIGGGEQSIFQICKTNKELGVKSKVLCLTKNEKKSIINYDGIKVIRYPQTFDYASCPISIQAFKNFKKESAWADIIHYHYPWPFGDLLSILTNKKYLITYHSDIVKQKLLHYLYYPLEQLFLSRAEKIIATSPTYAKTSKNLLKYNSKVEVIPLGLDITTYPKPNLNNCNKLKLKYGKFFVFLGQLRYYKGLDILLEAVVNTNYTLLILGDGPEKNKLQKICHDKKLENVHFLGKLNNQQKVDVLSSCYSLILPSNLRSEAYGLALIEGAMFGKPLISCSINTGTDYINKHLETGIVVPPNDPIALRKAMAELVNNPFLAKKMGKASFKRYNSLFTIKIMQKKLINLYKSLLG